MRGCWRGTLWGQVPQFQPQPLLDLRVRVTFPVGSGGAWKGCCRETLPGSTGLVPILPLGLCIPSHALRYLSPRQGTLDHTRWEGLAVDSFWCGASEVTQDQRSKLLGAELFSDFGGRMSQPSRQCCGEQRVWVGPTSKPAQCFLQTETLPRHGPMSTYWVTLF